MKKYYIPSIISVFLILLSGWLVSYGLDHRRVYFGQLGRSEEDARALSRIPGVLYEFGQQAWRGLDADGAADLFRQAVVRNPLDMDAWIKLAEARNESGDVDGARKIASFCGRRVGEVLRWKREHTLLAHDLALDDILRHNINYLVNREKWLSDVFYLVDTHTHNNTDQAIALLTPGNRPAYLGWLMRWKKADAAEKVWRAIESDGGTTDELLGKYVHFLVSQKTVPQAAALCETKAGEKGLTNGGFEKMVTSQGFDWRMPRSKNSDAWQGRRAFGQSHKGGHSLRISFHGRDNLKWHHIYQVVPVSPGRRYEMTYWWKSRGITTDQGPFVEVYGYDAKGLYEKGPMMIGSKDWQQAAVDITAPVDCHAVVVRLRRKESLRFDNKIQGVVWFDDFGLEEKDREHVAARRRSHSLGNL